MNNPELRDRLLELEIVTPELAARYNEKKKAIFERRLTPTLRVMWVLATIMGAGFFVLFSYAAILTLQDPGFPRIGTILFSVGALFGLGWAILGISFVKKGTASLELWNNATLKQMQTMHPAVAGMTWVFCVLLMVACQMMANDMPDTARGNQMILGGMVAMLMFAIPTMIMGHDTKSEIFMREKFLEIELQLAELRKLAAINDNNNKENTPDD